MTCMQVKSVGVILASFPGSLADFCHFLYGKWERISLTASTRKVGRGAGNEARVMSQPHHTHIHTHTSPHTHHLQHTHIHTHTYLPSHTHHTHTTYTHILTTMSSSSDAEPLAKKPKTTSVVVEQAGQSDKLLIDQVTDTDSSFEEVSLWFVL